MRHKKSFNHLGRKSAHRKAMLSNMAVSLILHKRIKTTTAKAKALKRYIEPLVTRAKDDSTHARRVAFSYLQDKEAVSELFREVGTRAADRPGGYTRIIKLGSRQGDNADMCLIELVDFNENMLAEKSASKKSSSRRRRGGGRSKSAAAKTPEKAPEKAPETKEETPGAEAASEKAPEAKEEAPGAEAASGEEAAVAEEAPEAKEEEAKKEDETDKK
ncbi:MAG: 50S ribosomal protein L17 [Bacteroidetes bacterium]|nr:MAG: 50S ribosomal protein L17 [Bacteroidota bacterium]